MPATNLSEYKPIGGTHYSELNQFRKCPQAWFYNYELGLRKQRSETSLALLFGTWWGALKSAWAVEAGEAAGTIIHELCGEIRLADGMKPLTSTNISVEAVLEQADRWWQRLSHERQTEWVDRFGAPARECLDRHLARWLSFYGDELPTWHPIAVEMYWEREIVDADSGASLKLAGYIDELYYDARRDQTVVLDNKTTATLDPATSADDLMDSQLQLYVWGAAKRVADYLQEQGTRPPYLKAPRAISYDRIRSALPATPQLTKSGTLSKSVTMYDAATYRAWANTNPTYPGLKKDGSGAGTYAFDEKVFEKLDTPAVWGKFFQRTLTPVSRATVTAHLRAAIHTAQAKDSAREFASKTYEAPRNLSKLVCGFCDFADLCRAQMVAGAEGEWDLAQFGLEQRSGNPMLIIE